MAPKNRTKEPQQKFSKVSEPFPPEDVSEAERSNAESEPDDTMEWIGLDGAEAGQEGAEDQGDESMEVDDISESEEELEKLVFGDSAGFRAGIRSFGGGAKVGTAQEEAEEDDQEADLENVADADLFFFDSGPGAAGAPSQALAPTSTEDEGDKPAWEDSDDERMFVSLASVPRLRKLRETEAEDVVNGKEYVRRLRKQYERLYPTPEWALQSDQKAKRKRRQSGTGQQGFDEDVSADEDMDMDEEEDLSAQPLAKLLKDADLLSRAGTGPRKKRKLQAGTIDIQRMKDITGSGPSAITSLSFHPTLPLLLSSGPSSTLYLHHINPQPPHPNPLLTSLHIKHTPLTTTAFHPSPTDSRIFLSARRRYFHIWNLSTGTIEKVTRIYGHQHEQKSMESFLLSPDGKYMALRGSSQKGSGVINILDAYTLQWVAQVRVESRQGIADFAWWGDGKGMVIVGKNGEVSEWDVRSQMIVARWVDEGAVGTTTIALGGRSGRDGWIGGDRWVAVGSSSGIVNVYDRRAWAADAASSTSTTSSDDDDDGVGVDKNLGIPRQPKPLRVLDHLTYPISHLTFSHDGQILAMASRWKRGAMRLVHLPSATVFRNWPTERTPLGRITAVAWGRPTDSEGVEALLSVANEQGQIRMWEIRA